MWEPDERNCLKYSFSFKTCRKELIKFHDVQCETNSDTIVKSPDIGNVLKNVFHVSPDVKSMTMLRIASLKR